MPYYTLEKRGARPVKKHILKAGSCAKARRKLRSRRGASLLVALLLFFMSTVACALILAVGTAAAGRRRDTAEADKAYYAVLSAAELFRDTLEKQKVTIEKVKTSAWTVKAGQDGKMDLDSVTYSFFYGWIDNNTPEDTSALYDSQKSLAGMPPSILRDEVWGLSVGGVTAGELEHYEDKQAAAWAYQPLPGSAAVSERSVWMHVTSEDGAGELARVRVTAGKVDASGNMSFTFTAFGGTEAVEVAKVAFNCRIKMTPDERPAESGFDAIKKSYTERETKTVTFTWVPGPIQHEVQT